MVREEEKSGQLYEAQHTCTCKGHISPDESDVEGDAWATRPVTWRTDDVSEYFWLLDEHWKAGMMSQRKNQSVSRILRLPSERTATGVPQHLLLVCAC